MIEKTGKKTKSLTKFGSRKESRVGLTKISSRRKVVSKSGSLLKGLELIKKYKRRLAKRRAEIKADFLVKKLRENLASKRSVKKLKVVFKNQNYRVPSKSKTVETKIFAALSGGVAFKRGWQVRSTRKAPTKFYRQSPHKNRWQHGKRWRVQKFGKSIARPGWLGLNDTKAWWQASSKKQRLNRKNILEGELRILKLKWGKLRFGVVSKLRRAKFGAKRRKWKPRKVDTQVKIARLRGRKLRIITKVGGRKVYRPLRKANASRWWKIRANKGFKRRKFDKPRLAFKFIARPRNDLETMVLRKRRFFTRHKRLHQYMAWKFSTPANLLHNAGRTWGFNHIAKHADLSTARKNPVENKFRQSRAKSLSGVAHLLDKMKYRAKSKVISNFGFLGVDPWSSGNHVLNSFSESSPRRLTFVKTKALSENYRTSDDFRQRLLNTWKTKYLLLKHSSAILIRKRLNAYWLHGKKHR